MTTCPLFDNNLTIGDTVTLDPRLEDPGHIGRVTQILNHGLVMIQWLTGEAQEKREHTANLLRLHCDYDYDQTMVKNGTDRLGLCRSIYDSL